MSSIAYGIVSAQRRAAPSEESKKEAKSPGFGSYVDVVAALVPAEVLAANAALLPLVTETNEENGSAVTAITEPGSLELVFWLSIAFSIAFFVAAEITRARKEKDAGRPAKPWDRWTTVRALIPASAYVVWTMLQKATAFDAIAPSMAEATRFIIAVFAALALGLIAKLLADEADRSTPPSG